MTAYIEIPYQDPVIYLQKVKNYSWPMLLHSANTELGVSEANRYSYLVFNPVEKFILQDGRWLNQGCKLQQDPFSELAKLFNPSGFEVIVDLPPFQGGLLGYFSYDLCHYLENIPLPACSETQFPELAVGLYDAVISFDHQQQKAWIVSSGYPLQNRLQKVHAEERLEIILNIIAQKNLSQSQVAQSCGELNFSEKIISNFSRDCYQKMVERSRQYILSGDIFEVNVAQCFSTKVPHDLDGFTLYQKLAKHNPAPFSAYLKLDQYEVISASPERFISVKQKAVQTKPIKGTIKRSHDPVEDQLLAQRLAQSQKDRAENIMIVDLMRNDISRVCEADSVKVSQLCAVESFATVHHLVSSIEGKLESDKDVFDLLRASFPGGSITGAPKVRAMQIISELEPSRRNLYCGSIAWINFNLDMDSSIVIRTFLRNQTKLTFQAGGAVVLGSDPAAEYEETLLKSQALREILMDEKYGYCYR